MRPYLLPIIAFALLAVGCDSADTPAAVEWQASLTGQPGFESVTGSATATSEPGQTAVSVNISGATPGAAHPWHIHTGTCASGGPITGNEAAYPELVVDGAGNANASATINLQLSTATAYFVNVHLSGDDLATIVACGNLTTAGGNPTGPPPGNGDY